MLGAGGMKTLGYAGALAALADRGVDYASISACSAGTFFGACLCAGVPPVKLVDSVLSTDLRRYLGEPVGGPLLGHLGWGNWRWPRARFKEAGMVALFRELAGGDPSFDDLLLPFATIGVEKRGMLIAAGRLAVERCLGQLAAITAESSIARVPPPTAAGPAGYDAMAENGASEVMARANSRLSSEVRDRVFISYARADRSWVDSFQVVLKGTLRSKLVRVWDNAQLGSGSAWREEIERQLKSTKVALLLVTNSFLASDFIKDVELKAILEAARGDGLVIVWVLVRQCDWQSSELEALNCANDTRRPLNSLNQADLDEAMLSIARQVRLALS